MLDSRQKTNLIDFIYINFKICIKMLLQNVNLCGKMDVLIKRGGGTGPVKPSNLKYQGANSR